MPISTLYVELKMSAESFNNEIKAAQREARAMEHEFHAMKDAAKEIGEGLSVVGDLTVVAMVEMTKKTAEYGAELEHAAQKTGATVEELSKLGFAAEQSGSSFDGLSTGLKFIAKNMEAAEGGSKKQLAAFADLGISAKDLADAGGDVSKVFLMMADGFKEMPDGAQKTSDALILAGRSGTALIPTLNQGSAAIEELGKAAESAGVVMSEATAKESAEYEAKMKEIDATVMGLSISVGTALLPALSSLASTIQLAVKDVSDFAREHEGLTKAIAATGLALGASGALLLGVAGVLTVLPTLTTAITLIGTVLTGPVGVTLAIAAVVSALAAFALKNDDTRKALTDAWDTIKDKLSGVLDALKVLFETAKSAWSLIWSTWGDTIKSLFSGIWESIKGELGRAFDLIKGVLGGALDILKGSIELFTGVITGDWGTFTKGIKDVWQGLWDSIKSIITYPIEEIKSAVTGFTTGVSDAFKDVYDKVVGHSYVPDMMEGIRIEFGKLDTHMKTPAKNACNDVLNSFENMLNGIIDKLTNKIPIVGGLIGNLLGGIADKLVSKGLGSLLGGTSLGGLIGLGGAAGPAGTSIVGAGTSTLAMPGGAGMASLGAFMTNPITIAVGAAIGAAILWTKSQAHHEADTFVKEVQNPFGDKMMAIYKAETQAINAGQLTAEQAKIATANVQELWDSFQNDAKEFAKGGSDEAKVVQQAFATLTPIMKTTLDDMNGRAAALAAQEAAAALASGDLGGTLTDVGSTMTDTGAAGVALTGVFGDLVDAINQLKKVIMDFLSGISLAVKPTRNPFPTMPPISDLPNTPTDSSSLLMHGDSQNQLRWALSGGLAAGIPMPAYASGTNYVPRTGPAIVHQGEKIIPASQNNDGDVAGLLRELISAVRAGHRIEVDGHEMLSAVNRTVERGGGRLVATQVRR